MTNAESDQPEEVTDEVTTEATIAPEAPETPAKNKKTGLITGLSVLALLVIGALVVAFLWVGGVFKGDGDPGKIAAQYFPAQSCGELQSLISEAEWADLSAGGACDDSSIKQRADQFKTDYEATVGKVTIKNTVADVEITLKAKKAEAGQPSEAKLNFNLIKIDDNWKIDHIRNLSTTASTQ